MAESLPPSPFPTPRHFTYRVLARYPHDTSAFTEGLVYDNGVLFESTGLYGQSTLRRVDLETGNVLQVIDLPKDLFGEGLTVIGDRLIQLTWKAHTGFVYDKASLKRISRFTYPTEGWGLTFDGSQLIMSDGSATLYFLDPRTFTVTRQVQVSDSAGPVEKLNELEYINGEVYANVWLTDRIVCIDPLKGQVLASIDLTGLLPNSARTQKTDVLNGIAYDPDRDRLFVTGKFWPWLYQIRLVPAKGSLKVNQP